MAGKLASHERETVISFTKDSNQACVFTYQTKWITQLKSLGATVIQTNGYGGVEFEVPKTWIRIPLPPRKRLKGEQ